MLSYTHEILRCWRLIFLSECCLKLCPEPLSFGDGPEAWDPGRNLGEPQANICMERMAWLLLFTIKRCYEFVKWVFTKWSTRWRMVSHGSAKDYMRNCWQWFLLVRNIWRVLFSILYPICFEFLKYIYISFSYTVILNIFLWFV